MLTSQYHGDYMHASWLSAILYCPELDDKSKIVTMSGISVKYPSHFFKSNVIYKYLYWFRLNQTTNQKPKDIQFTMTWDKKRAASKKKRKAANLHNRSGVLRLQESMLSYSHNPMHRTILWSTSVADKPRRTVLCCVVGLLPWLLPNRIMASSSSHDCRYDWCPIVVWLKWIERGALNESLGTWDIVFAS